MLDVEPDGLFAEILFKVFLGQDRAPLPLHGSDVLKVIFTVFAKADVIELFDCPSVEWIFLWVWFLPKVVLHWPDV